MMAKTLGNGVERIGLDVAEGPVWFVCFNCATVPWFGAEGMQGNPQGYKWAGTMMKSDAGVM